MPNSPKANEEKMNKMITAWRTLASDKSFGGMTFTQFEAIVNDALESRLALAAIDDSRTEAITTRENLDNVFLQKAQLVVNGVLADPAYGDDSALYEALGYIRKSERKSGLTRKKDVIAKP